MSDFWLLLEKAVIFYATTTSQWFKNIIYKKSQKAHEKVFAGIFLPLGSGLAIPCIK